MGLACADPTASRAVALKTLAPIKHLSIIARMRSLPVAALAKSSRDCAMPDAPVTALRGTIVSFTGDPFLIDTAESCVHEPDGLIVCRNGIIEPVGAYDIYNHYGLVRRAHGSRPLRVVSRLRVRQRA